MAALSLLDVPGASAENNGKNAGESICTTSDTGVATNLLKRRRVGVDTESLCGGSIREIVNILPTLSSPDYYMKPCIKELKEWELMDPGYCSRVPDFTVGRIGYGFVRFLGSTDVRWLDLDQIVKFHRHEVIVYEDETMKPAVGKGLNKAAEVSLIIHTANLCFGNDQAKANYVMKKLRKITERQGATFISFDLANGLWKFLVNHFSRFGLARDEDEDEADDIEMDNATGVENPAELEDDFDNSGEHPVDPMEPELSHSLPAHLGLDPAKMKEMRMVMFPAEEEDEVEDVKGLSSHQRALSKRHVRWPVQNLTQRINHRNSSPVMRKIPLALLENSPNSDDLNSHGSILMAQQNRASPVKTMKAKGFVLDLKHETPVTGSHSRNIVDAALFMGRSFRVGWGPNGVLVHAGTPMTSNSSQRVLSSVINIEKVAIDKVVRDENNEVRKELVKSAFVAPLGLHKELDNEIKEVEVGSYNLRLYKIVATRLGLSEICRSYIGIIEKHLDVPGLSSSARLTLMHQVMVWELIKVLFSERENNVHTLSMASDSEEDMIQDEKEVTPEVDPEALPLIRRAEFSCWLQESVCHRVQEDISSLNDSQYLEHLFFLLSGRQLDAAVELAISSGDVGLACLVAQAGGSTVNRNDIARQLNLWRINGLDFNFIEKDRVRLYELLAGNIHDALLDAKIDWKRFIGLLMWYHLPPDTSLPAIFQNYQNLLNNGKAPTPVPIYVDEGTAEKRAVWSREKHFDLLYYLMLLHGSKDREVGFLKTMFSAFSSTNDPLDYHMIWHQREVIEAVGAFSSDDLQVLDMGFVSQLLCQGQIHWAIYVVLHMPHREDYPYLHATVIREILFQYCECWSSEESQWEFIENLGVPSEWLHEALAIYYSYIGDSSKSLEHFLDSSNWQKAHSIFVTSVAHSLFLSAKHSEVWRIATSMEDHKSEIENWDLGAGIYISFYLLKSSLQEDGNAMGELDSLESKNDACRSFIGRLNEALAVWEIRLPLEARVAYSKMAEEICEMLLSNLSEGPTREEQLSCFDTAFRAPIPEELRSSHLQDAVSLFTLYLSETAA